MSTAHKKRRQIYISAVIVILLGISMLTAFSYTPWAAFAAEVGDTFSVMFPTAQYFQSVDPTLISANDKYLLVYDKTVSALFVQGPKNTSYSLDFKNVDDIFAVGDTAFINADGGYYSIDLKDSSANAVQRELPTPEHISFFSSDGTYLYAKSVAGYVSVYDENLQIASLGIDNVLNADLLAGFPVLAGRDGRMYVFSTVFGNPFLVVYDPSTGEESKGIQMKCYVTEAYIGDIIYAQISTVSGGEGEPNIIGIDKDTGEELFKSDVTPDSFYAFEDKLFAIEGNRIVMYTLNEDRSGLTMFSTISMAGSDDSHLNAPTDAVKYKNSIAVADGGNNRISLISGISNMNVIALPSSPLRVSSDGNSLYALCADGKIYRITDGEIEKTYDAEGAVDIVYLDKLYILKADGLYTSLGGGIYKLNDVADGKRVACAENGENLYVLKDGGVCVLGKDGEMITELSANLENAEDIAVDYAGEIYALYNGKIQRYKNKILSLEMTAEVPLSSSFIRATANSAHLDGDSLYFTAEECFIGKLNPDVMQFATADSYDVLPYAPSGAESYYFAKPKDGVKTVVLPSDGRTDGMRIADDDTVLVLSADTGLGDEFAYALLDGKISIIAKSDYDEVLTDHLTDDYVTTCDTVIYALPDIETGSIELDEGTRFSLISDCADYEDGKWLRAAVGGKVYFVKASDCAEYTYVKPEAERIYGKAKASRVGGLVNVYSDSNADSGTVAQIVDGTKVEILDESADYYLVRYGDVIGFMLKDEVQLHGLTSVQIIAVVLAVFVTLTAICIFVVIETTKKKSAEKDKNSKSK